MESRGTTSVVQPRLGDHVRHRTLEARVRAGESSPSRPEWFKQALELALVAPGVRAVGVVELLVEGDDEALERRELDALHAWLAALVAAGPVDGDDPAIDEQLRLWTNALEAMQ